MRDLLDTTTTAAAQTDRWLFIATLIVLGIFALMVMRYFVKQHERLIDDHQLARESYQKSLVDIVATQAKTNGELGHIIQRNTEALTDNNAQLLRLREERA